MNLSGKVSGLLQALRARLPRRSSKGTAELGVVFVSASLVLGVLFGNGLSRTSLDVTDGLSWLKDEPTGEVIQVNPATGRPTARLDVGSPGDALDIAQYDGRLIVTNRTTGELISFDLATLLASGQRSVATGDATTVLHHDGDVFLVDRSQGTLSAMDPVTADVIGEVWTSAKGIVDARVDGRGTVWVLDDEGLVTGLVWSREDQGFDKTESRQVKASGPGSRLVAHDRGVTLFGPDNGIVVQIGTGKDVVANAPRLAGRIEQPEGSPRDLVPASSPQTGTVVIVGDRDIREVNVASIGCRKPGRPQVYRGVVYVPCLGAGKVIRLDAQGRTAGPDILLPEGGDPELVVDDGLLLINVQGAERGVQVMPDGSTRTFLRRDPSVPLQKVHPNTDPQIDFPDFDEIANQDRDHGRQNHPKPKHPDNPGVERPDPADPGKSDDPRDPGNNPDPGKSNGPGVVDDPLDPGSDDPTSDDPTSDDPTSDDPTSDDPPVDPPDPEPLSAPTNVTAALLANGSVQVTWSHPGEGVTSFEVSREGGSTLATVSSTARQAVVTVPPGSASRFIVTAVREDERRSSSASGPVTPTARPGSATGVAASGSVRVTSKVETATYRVSWGAAPDNGSPITGYTVTFNTGDGTRTLNMGASDRSASTSWGCPYVYDPDCYVAGGSFTVTVTANNAHGAGPGVTASGDAGAPANPVPEPVPALPGGGRQHVTNANHRFDSIPVEGFGQSTLTIAPPSDWAGFEGTCSYSYVGGYGQSSGGPIACNATTLTVQHHTGYIRTQDGKWVTVSNSIVFTANNGQGTVQSASFQWDYQQDTLGRNEQPP